MNVTYSLNGINFRDFSVVVSGSKGLLDQPKRKMKEYRHWPEVHGEMIDPGHCIYDARDIVLDCFIAANSAQVLTDKFKAFATLLESPGTHRLMVDAGMEKPLLYEVYHKEPVVFNKKWRHGRLVGTFSLKLREPEPVKRVVKFTGVTCNITLTTQWPVNIYWGDGSSTFDVEGTTVSVTKNFPEAAIRFAMVTGNIELLSFFSTNGEVVWHKL